MKKVLLLLIITVYPCSLFSQPKKNGRVPVREKRGYNQRIVIDTANMRVPYALNANAIVGGKSCTCSCYWYGQGGSPSGTNTYANYGIGGHSCQGCNQFYYSDELGMGASSNVSAS